MQKVEYKEFAALRGDYYGQVEKVQSAPSWRDRIMKMLWPQFARDAFDLSAENRKLREKLLAALLECEAAGRNGLLLYAENEDLRERVQITPEQMVARVHQLDELRRENNQLKHDLANSRETYESLSNTVDDWLVKFGEKER